MYGIDQLPFVAAVLERLVPSDLFGSGDPHPRSLADGRPELRMRLIRGAKSHNESAADQVREPSHRSLLFNVGGDLNAHHAIGIGRWLTALELVHHVHPLDHLADHRVLAVEERALLEHDEKLAVG